MSIPIEILSPVGGAGCFYQRRPLAGALVVAGSVIAGASLLWAASHGDRDATILNAVAYGVVRGAGVWASALPAPTALPAPPAPSGKTAGLWPRWSF